MPYPCHIAAISWYCDAHLAHSVAASRPCSWGWLVGSFANEFPETLPWCLTPSTAIFFRHSRTRCIHVYPVPSQTAKDGADVVQFMGLIGLVYPGVWYTDCIQTGVLQTSICWFSGVGDEPQACARTAMGHQKLWWAAKWSISDHPPFQVCWFVFCFLSYWVIDLLSYRDVSAFILKQGSISLRLAGCVDLS